MANRRSAGAGEALTRPPTTEHAKLARVTAARIVQDVIDRDWPVGEVLGAEPAMLERYGVSRAVFREAVRLVEQQQVARTRRGPGGGLVVTEPTVEAIIEAAVVYLHRVGASLEEVFDARLALEELVAELAPERLDEADLDALRRLVADEAAGEVPDHRALHSLLAAATHNPALELFVDILNRLSLLWFHDRRELGRATVDASHYAHRRIVEAVLAGDGATARRRMRTHLRAEVDFLRARRSVRRPLPVGLLRTQGDGEKRAETLARVLLEEVVVGQRLPGELLGTEPELMERFDVSRAVLREAVRLLEHHGVAAMRRGPGGGLVVTEPDVAAVTDVVAIYLARRRMRPAELAELRTRLELHLLDLVAERPDGTGPELIAASVAGELEGRDDERLGDLHEVLAAHAGNRALQLLALVLIRLSRVQVGTDLDGAARTALRRAVHEEHAAIADALTGGDVELARHRMRRHLQALDGRLR